MLAQSKECRCLDIEVVQYSNNDHAKKSKNKSSKNTAKLIIIDMHNVERGPVTASLTQRFFSIVISRSGKLLA